MPRPGFFCRAGADLSASAATLICVALLIAGAPVPAAADTPAAALADETLLDRLATDITWLRLLHFDQHKSRSEIITDDFFLADSGALSPRDELQATIQAYYEPIPEAPDTHALCRFPARYLWLSRHLSLPHIETVAEQCPKLARWAKLPELRSLSLIMVSGYFANPASSFGHILLKLNTGEGDSNRLLDLGINYGALVPQNELVPVYIFKGLFGGYQAGFSDRTYYTQDLVYSRIESRDMWEYELNLDEYQTRLIVFHLWEVVGKKFAYYFLKENCGYRMAELIELATGQDFVGGVKVWYAPVAVFHRMREVSVADYGPLFRSVRFIPSSQRVLYATFDQLNPTETAVANTLIRDGLDGNLHRLAALPVEQQQMVLNALLAYYGYRLAGKEEDEPSTLRDAKNRVLSYRLELPPTIDYTPPAIADLTTPSQGARPSSWSLGAAHTGAFGSYYSTRYAAFDYDAIGNNNLDGSELVVFDLGIGFSDAAGSFLDYWDWIRARKINTDRSSVAGESSWSWEIGVGVQRESNDCTDCRQFYLSGGLGRAVRLAKPLSAYALLGLAANSGPESFAVVPTLGVALQGSRWRSELEIDYAYRPRRSAGSANYKVATRYSLAQNHELRLSATKHGMSNLSVAYVYHW